MQAVAKAMIRLDSRWHDRPVRPPSADTRFIELRDATVRIRVLGSGPRTLMLAPDPPNMIEHYDELLPMLAPHYRVICFEPPGFGFSTPRPHFGYTLPELADLVVELLERLEARRVTLSFACVAAFVAAMVARRRPDLVERLVLLQAPAHHVLQQWTRQEDFLGIIATPGLGQLALALPIGKRIAARQWYASAFPSRAEGPPMLERTLRAFREGASFCLASQFQAFQRGTERFEDLSQDTLVIWGDADPTHRGTDRRSVLENFPSARLVELRGVSHFPDLERPDDYLRCLLGPAER